MKIIKFIFILAVIFIFICSPLQANRYENALEAGYAVGLGKFSNNEINLAMINGCRFSPYLFLGVGVGIGYTNNLRQSINEQKFGLRIDKEKRQEALLLPIFGVFKVNFTQTRWSPYIALNIGYKFDLTTTIGDSYGYILRPAAGIDFKIKERRKVYLQIGYSFQNTNFRIYQRSESSVNPWSGRWTNSIFNAIDIRLGVSF